MGTPEFAVPCLDMLTNEGYNVIGVVTQPDKPKGRGHKLAQPPVKEYALQKGIPVYQPKTLKNNAFENTLKKLAPDLIVVVAYGKILPKYILEYPNYGCINVHASLLPKYRGAGPIQWAVINGEKETGITTMFMDEGMDTGDMILKKKTQIRSNETAGELHDRLSALGAEVLKETLALVEKGSIPRMPQPHQQATYAPMLDKSIAKIDWAKPAIEIKNLVRGLNPWPVAFTYYKGRIMKIWSVDIVKNCTDGVPGIILKHIKGQGLAVKAGDNNCIIIEEVQFEGGKRMKVDEYLRGHSIEFGECLG
jgi:methionyl-tRNA formyltransferase